MQAEKKQKLLSVARTHIDSVRAKISKDIETRTGKFKEIKKGLNNLLPGDALAQMRLAAHNDEEIENLTELEPSPYFARCEFKVGQETKNYYFGKFSFTPENIYSWITPAAALRFESPGLAGYIRPDGQQRSGVLLEKDQYHIAGGRLLFFSTQSVDAPRELIYQENFTRQKSGFILPEVVEQMEKAQDQVVRAPYRGPFLISGPAGSGKTTLALHRVAYLMQSPETAPFFTADNILILVQDAGTKQYFSRLLPDLGIRGVEILTFSEWAQNILEINNSKTPDYEESGDFSYQSAKLAALKNLPVDLKYAKNHFTVLARAYNEHFTAEHKKIFAIQKKDLIFDRFDLTLLLALYQKNYEKFFIKKEMFVESTAGTYRRRNIKRDAQYNMVVIDEFQNYLPEQLAILRSCLNPRLQSAVYVGDLKQQTRLGTVREFGEIKGKIEPERRVVLQKIYRNTKNILKYIAGLGYDVTIPEGLKSGSEVREEILDIDGQIERVKEILDNMKGGTLGILGKDKDVLRDFEQVFVGHENVRVMTMAQAQGVEFETVCLVGVNDNLFQIDDDNADEIKKIYRDLLYVALTRAMNDLYVFGGVGLKNVCRKIF